MNQEVLEGKAQAPQKQPAPVDGNGRALLTSPKKYIIGGLLVLLVAFGGFGGWALIAPLTGAAVAPGQVTVDSYRQSVQHLEGGIVREILVRDGMMVEEGDKLLKLDETDVHAERESVALSYVTEAARAARLRAEQGGLDEIIFPDFLQEIAAGDPEMEAVLEGQRQHFLARKDSLESEIAVRERTIDQINDQIRGLEAVVRSERAQIESYKEEVVEWEELFENQMTDKQRLREVRRELNTLEGSLANNMAEIARLRGQVEETRTQILLTERNFREQVVENLREAERNALDARVRLNALDERLRRTTITAPAEGEVVGMSAHTIGGVIAPGDTILEIVPQTRALVIEARVAPGDIDRVYRGLKADIRFSAFSAQTTHVIEGEVINVSADALEDEREGTEYYLARIQVTEQGREQMIRDEITLVPGMPAQVFIQTEGRTFMQYLVKPVTDMFASAFRED